MDLRIVQKIVEISRREINKDIGERKKEIMELNE